jgi:hypothetical protein
LIASGLLIIPNELSIMTIYQFYRSSNTKRPDYAQRLASIVTRLIYRPSMPAELAMPFLPIN